MCSYSLVSLLYLGYTLLHMYPISLIADSTQTDNGNLFASYTKSQDLISSQFVSLKTTPLCIISWLKHCLYLGQSLLLQETWYGVIFTLSLFSLSTVNSALNLYPTCFLSFVLLNSGVAIYRLIFCSSVLTSTK